MTLFIWLFFLTFPIFYIIGFFTIIKSLFGNNKNDEIVERIKSTLHHDPNKSLKEFLDEFKKADNFYIESKAPPIYDDFTSEKENADEIQTKSKDTNSFWDNWYSNNSINLLLYMGAFLIVAAASIFVGFQWNSIPGILKAVMLTLLSLIFILCGFWFHGIQKIKSAGSTFVGIGGLLIPVCATGWYNFVLKDAGISGGTIWFGTSLISIILFSFFSIKFKESFYSYAGSFSALSLALSFVNVAKLSNETYILASLASCFLLLITGLVSRKSNDKNYNYFGLPLELSAQIIMPTTLIYGLILGSGQNLLFTLQGALSIFLAALFYYILFLEDKATYALVITEGLLPLGFYFLYGWLKIPDSYLLYTISFIGMVYIYISLLLREKRTSQALDVSLFYAIAISAFTFIIGYISHLNSWEKLIFSMIPIGISSAVAFIKKDINFGYLATFFAVITSFIFVTTILPSPYNKVGYISFPLTTLAVIVFLQNIKFRKLQNVSNFLTFNTFIFMSISILLNLNNYSAESALLLITAIFFWVARLIWGNKSLTYGMTSSLYFSLLFLLFTYKTEYQFYPLIFTGFSLALYGYQFLTGRHRNEFANTALFVQAVISIVFSTNIYFGSNYMHQYDSIKFNTLVSIYATMILYFFDSINRKLPYIDYAASIAGLFTLLAQFKYSGYENILFYTIPTGIYLLIMGEVRREHDIDSSNLLSLSGSLTVIAFPFLLSYQEAYYSLILGLISICLLFAGISIRRKIFTYTGSAGLVLAVLPQVYSYLLQIPKWVIVGIVGLIFVISAIYLLLNRKESDL